VARCTATVVRLRDLLRIAGDTPAYVVLNFIHPNATRQVEEAKEMIERVSGLKACPVHLCNRESYGEAPTTGKAPLELDPEGSAAAELKRLYRFTRQHVEKPTSHHEQDHQSAESA
jgi:chromosome partitioning protein